MGSVGDVGGVGGLMHGGACWSGGVGVVWGSRAGIMHGGAEEWDWVG